MDLVYIHWENYQLRRVNEVRSRVCKWEDGKIHGIFYVNSPLCSNFHEILTKGLIWLQSYLVLFAGLLQQKEMSVSYRQEIEIKEKYFENHISKTVGSISLPFRFM